MLKDITIGQFIDTGSFLHRMDSRIKLILTILYVVCLFLIDSPMAYAVFCLFTLFLIILSKIPVKVIIKGLKPMVFILVFTVLINIFMIPGERVFSLDVFGLFSLGVSREGIISALFMAVRIIFLVIGTSLLTLTTTPIMLTDGVEKL